MWKISDQNHLIALILHIYLAICSAISFLIFSAPLAIGSLKSPWSTYSLNGLPNLKSSDLNL